MAAGDSCDYDELRPHPSDCSRFLQCSYGGIEYDMPCPMGHVQMHFSYENQMCDYPANVNCHLGEGT